MEVTKYVGQFEDRKYFKWDRFIPMLAMKYDLSNEVKDKLIEALELHMEISEENSEQPSSTKGIKA